MYTIGMNWKKKARNLPVKIDIVLKIYCWDSSLKFLGELKAIFLPLLSAERVVFNVFQMTYVGPWRPKKKKIKTMGEEAKKWGVPQADARISLKSLLANFSWKIIPVFIWKWMAWVQFNFYLMNLQVVANHISISNSPGEFSKVTRPSNPKGCGGCPKVTAGREIVCHFSQSHAMVTKILDFIHKHLNYKIPKSFFDFPDRFFRNLAETDKKLGIFAIENHKIDIFSIFYNKVLKFYFKYELQFLWGFFWGI